MKPLWQAEDVLRAVRGQCLHEQSWEARGVALDGRATKSGDLFVALKGSTRDAHDFVSQAFAAGAAAAIVQRAPSQVPPDAPMIFVEDTYAALQDLGRVARQRAAAKVLAVTGSRAAASSQELLALMLETLGETCASAPKLESRLGVPLALARLPALARFGVFHVRLDRPGSVEPWAREILPDVSLITEIEAATKEPFASADIMADAAAELFLGMGPSGTAVLNRDSPTYSRLLAAARTQGLKNILTFGHHAKSDARLIDVTDYADGCEVRAVVRDQPVTYYLGAPSLHIAFNALGALLAAVSAGADLVACAEALRFYRLSPGYDTQQMERAVEALKELGASPAPPPLNKAVS
ncbi:MAG: hypothetical protein HGA90_01430 [Alphaproteobacteria bacterium]|nr:hypothetical protein [Alphaproteobacteria bacterium]